MADNSRWALVTVSYHDTRNVARARRNGTSGESLVVDLGPADIPKYVKVRRKSKARRAKLKSAFVLS